MIMEIKSAKLWAGSSWRLVQVRALVRYIGGHQLQSTGGPHVCLHVSKVGEVGIESTRTPIFLKSTFVLLLFINT